MGVWHYSLQPEHAAYPHWFILDVEQYEDDRDAYAAMTQAMRWANTQFGWNYKIVRQFSWSIAFSDQRDAFAFKMRWC